MVVFDLREEAQMMAWMYMVAPITVLLVLTAMAPFSVRARLPLVLPEDVRPLALFFVVFLSGMVWHEDYERRQAAVTVERCLNGGCNLVEGRVSGVVPVQRVTSGGRVSLSSYRGGVFRVGEKFFSHYPSDFSNYSPANHIHDGDVARVYSFGEVLVLVEKVE
jgi:hypothetical protein